jgi:hypothetical protein
MGYFWDEIDRRWQPKDRDRKYPLPPKVWEELERRGVLIKALLGQMKDGDDGVATLYAGLLAGRLCQSDELLMAAHGKEVAALLPQDKARAPGCAGQPAQIGKGENGWCCAP